VECFYHDGRTAVGSCRSCLKGICRSCVVDLGKGLACANRCEQAVRDLIATLEQSIQYRGISAGILRTTRGLWLGLAAVALLVGLFVVVWGLNLPTFREISLLGIAFLLIGAMLLRVARGIRGSAEQQPSSAG
jgi:hypothetical protein